MRFGADLSAQDQDSFLPVHIAARYGNTAVMDILLKGVSVYTGKLCRTRKRCEQKKRFLNSCSARATKHMLRGLVFFASKHVLSEAFEKKKVAIEKSHSHKRQEYPCLMCWAVS